MLEDLEEYTLLLIKPDGVEKNMVDEAVKYFKEMGMIEARRSRRIISKRYASEIFTSKYLDDIFIDYMSRGESEAVLFKGNNAYDIMRISKVELRKKLGVDGEIENVVHSPEAGNEYERQLHYFFPDIYHLVYCMYADMYVKVSFCNVTTAFLDSLCDYDQSTNSKLIYIFQNDEIDFYRSDFERYIELQGKINWIFGIEYNVIFDGKIMKVVVYYRTTDIANIVVDDGEALPIENVLDQIKSNHGVPYLGFSKLITELDEVSVKKLLYMGIIGVVTYHPMYSIKETELIRGKFLPQGFVIAGGSGGIADPGTYSISYSIVEQLYTKLTEENCGG